MKGVGVEHRSNTGQSSIRAAFEENTFGRQLSNNSKYSYFEMKCFRTISDRNGPRYAVRTLFWTSLRERDGHSSRSDRHFGGDVATRHFLEVVNGEDLERKSKNEGCVQGV